MTTLIVLFAILVAIFVHWFKIGSPYIEASYCAGRIRYYVWIRRTWGFNDLAGSCDTEQEARQLLDKVKREPPKASV